MLFAHIDRHSYNTNILTEVRPEMVSNAVDKYGFSIDQHGLINTITIIYVGF